jgi:UDP-GlcNAc:undecaprenyl-phosphate/decaprenyl-phosphate GlcNAc-1-phosphate transferase
VRIVFYALVGGVAAAVTFGLSYLIWRLSTKYRLYPAIRARDVHTRPTPRLGGIAMFFGVVAAMGVASQFQEFALIFSEPTKVLAVLGAAFLITVVGVADDIWDLDWTIKLAVQILAAVLLAWGGVQLLTLPVGGILMPGALLSLTLTVFAVVLVMNAVNFIDGLDGLVAGVAIIANGVFFIYVYLLQLGNRFEYYNLASLITVVLAGACFGFLLLNWHPAKLFMGDSGALLVGLLMATASISVTGGIDPEQIENQEITRSALLGALIPVILPLAILVVPLLDFGLAVIRRIRAGKSPFSADRLHLHHRLLDMGHSHFHAVLIFYAWTTVLAVGCLLPLFVHWGWAVAFIGIGLGVCVVVTLLPLTRKKAAETAAQSAPPGIAEAAKFDPLDAASTGQIPLPTELDALERIRKKKEKEA